MSNSSNIFKTPIFSLSLISSCMLLLTVMYGQKLFMELWILALAIEIPVFIFFIVMLAITTVFWIRHKKSSTHSYVPFLTCLIFLTLIIVLPLNWIRVRTGFSYYRKEYEAAATESLKTNNVKSRSMVSLSKEYSFLSEGGDVVLINRPGFKAVLFYTFRGVPDGMAGFMKVDKAMNEQSSRAEFQKQLWEFKDLGDNWYFIRGERL